MGNGFANADQLLKAAKGGRRYRAVDLPVCGAKVRLQSLTEGELSAYHRKTVSKRGGIQEARLEDATRRLLVLCLVDGAGNRLFSDGDTDKLRDFDAADTQHLYDECASHVGINRDDIEALVKNSEATNGDAAPTGSPATSAA